MNAPEDRLFKDYQRTGDPATLGEVYDLVSTELLHVALHLTGRPADAEDALQSTFIVAIERAAEFDSSKRVLPWLTGILANRARLLRARAGRRTDPERLERSAGAGPVEHLEGLELDEQLGDALQRVPMPFRTVLILRLRHGMSAVEIAHALGRPPGTVRSQMARGLEVLKRSLPSSIVGASLALLATSGRGLAAVREAIVVHAASVQSGLAAATAAATTAPAGSLLLATTGSLAVKNVLLGIGCVVLAAAGLFSFMGSSDPVEEVLVPRPVAASLEATDLQPIDGATSARSVTTAADVDRIAAALSPPPAAAPPATAPASGDVVVHAVHEEDDSPAAGVFAMLTYRREGAPYMDERLLRTDSRGIARFAEVPASGGTVMLLRGRMRSLAFDREGTTHVTLAMPVGLVVEGEVVDDLGRPVPGAEIWISERWRSDKGHIIAEADGAGRFELASITSDHFIGARAPGLGLSYVQSARGKPGDRVPMRIVLASAGGRVRGVVVGPDGLAVAGAEVKVGERDPEETVVLASGVRVPDSPPQYAWTDAEGAFETESIPLGRTQVKVRAPGYATWSREVDVVAEGGEELLARLEGETVVTGRVATAEGEPVSGAHVHTPTPWRFGGSSGFSGADGAFLLRGLGPGATTLVAEHPESGRTELAVTLGPGEEFHWDPVLLAVPRIFGRLVDEAGSPLPGRQVIVRDEATGESPTTDNTNADGGFTATVEAGRPYLVIVNDARGWRYFPSLVRRGVKAGTQPLVLVLGPELAERGTIEGTVLAPDGSIPVGAQVDLWHNEERVWKTFDVSGVSGELSIDGIPAGTVDLTVHCADHPTERLSAVTVEAGETTDLGEIRLTVSGRVSGTITGVPDEALESLELSVSGLDGGSGTVQRSLREFESSALAPGRYNLSLAGDFLETVWVPVVIEAGSDLVVELATKPAGMCRVRFDRPEGGAAPKWIGCTAVDSAGRFAWSGGARRTGDGPFEARISAAPGRYTISATASNGLKGVVTVDIVGFAGEGELVRLELLPE